jgi:hypothetical protein
MENPKLAVGRSKMATLLSKWQELRKKRKQETKARSAEVSSLVEQWRSGRRRRQQENIQRANEVSTTLNEFRTSLRRETQASLSQNSQQRMLRSAQQQQELAEFMGEMKSNVQNFLQDFSQRKKTEVQQMRSKNLAELSELSASLHSELRQYRGNLTMSVWGNNGEIEVYDYIQNKPGVKITEIEQALGMTRVKTVDTIADLKQKGMIVEREQLFFLP